MKQFFCLLFFLHAAVGFVFAQAKTRRLPGIINHPSLNVYSPYISHDGNALLFVSDMGEDGSLTVAYTSRENDWVEPVELPKHINSRSTFLRGFSLSADGRKLLFTSAKSPVVGGYDIMSSDLKGNVWGEAQNLLLPINSKTNDACPSLSADGNTLYFMRCDKMDQRNASACKLFRADKKPNGQWSEPVELPANINTGNSQAPRIMADSETLIFSSDKLPSSKGGMDLYLTRLENGRWSDPVPLDFVNTEQDDQFVAVAALGRYLIKETIGTRKNSELVEFLIPQELRPRGMMKIEGTILDEKGAAISSYITIMDLSNSKRVFSGRPSNNGSYYLYLREGSKYEMSIDPEQSKVRYFTKQFDLMTDKIPQREKINVTLAPPFDGDELNLERVQFKSMSYELEPTSETELKKLVRLIKSNPELNFEIQVLLTGYEEDSVKSSPDLTEVLVDSVHTQVDDIDSLGQIFKRDTVIAKTTYHNDRTQLQAKTIVDTLIRMGVNPESLQVLTNAIPAVLPDSRKLVIKALARSRTGQ